jgi:hypothetical protein
MKIDLSKYRDNHPLEFLNWDPAFAAHYLGPVYMPKQWPDWVSYMGYRPYMRRNRGSKKWVVVDRGRTRIRIGSDGNIYTRQLMANDDGYVSLGPMPKTMDECHSILFSLEI